MIDLEGDLSVHHAPIGTLFALPPTLEEWSASRLTDAQIRSFHEHTTKANGCVHYVPGSHQWKLLPKTGLADGMTGIERVLADEQRRAFEPVALELTAGEASFHHPLIVHGSYENRTDGPRRGAVVNMMRDGVRSASNEPLLEGVPVIPRGEAVAGRFFPLLFDPVAVGL